MSTMLYDEPRAQGSMENEAPVFKLSIWDLHDCNVCIKQQSEIAHHALKTPATDREIQAAHPGRDRHKNCHLPATAFSSAVHSNVIHICACVHSNPCSAVAKISIQE